MMNYSGIIGKQCLSDDNCTVENSLCLGNICSCLSGYHVSENGTSCTERNDTGDSNKCSNCSQAVNTTHMNISLECSDCNKSPNMSPNGAGTTDQPANNSHWKNTSLGDPQSYNIQNTESSTASINVLDEDDNANEELQESLQDGFNKVNYTSSTFIDTKDDVSERGICKTLTKTLVIKS